MKRIIILLVVCIVLTGCHAVDENDYSTTIYYVPHPDDETLSMGPSILHNVELNKEVVVVLLSKGRASKAIGSVNKKLEKEDLPPITLEEFGEARVAEFTKAVAALGVKKENVYIYDIEDGDFSTGEVAPIIQDFEKKYPEALHNVMSYNDPHDDHSSTGKALRELMDAREVQYGLYHIPVQRHKKMLYKGSYAVPSSLIDDYKVALEAYGKWEPEEGSYSIGQSSVRKYFDRAIDVMESRWHQ
ncbi:PIG-L family deacetylase [Sporosarcina limicola]|uniref:LmbE family N-acetylglucosaminyl deacetylase n=1 Tax=Sporosarcina limicola TaxID=34101 RepID=A0A927REY7_9BACL|nr:PIG-L family deacetylase [Sporosarcina limicola]MBE1556770.1 LmbE family N-acetylglucosaminyl deacetylase [Sporosarcina limicola]